MGVVTIMALGDGLRSARQTAFIELKALLHRRVEICGVYTVVVQTSSWFRQARSRRAHPLLFTTENLAVVAIEQLVESLRAGAVLILQAVEELGWVGTGAHHGVDWASSSVSCTRGMYRTGCGRLGAHQSADSKQTICIHIAAWRTTNSR